MVSTSETPEQPFGCNLWSSPGLSTKRPTSMMIPNPKDSRGRSLNKNGSISSDDDLPPYYVPERAPPRRHEFRRSAQGIKFVKSLMDGIRLYIKVFEDRKSFYPDDRTLHCHIKALQTKLKTVTELLREYEGLLNANSTTNSLALPGSTSQSNKKQMNRFHSFLSLFMPARDGSKSGSSTNLPEIHLSNNNSTGKAATLKNSQQQQHSREDRLRGIEEQIGRLSGCFHLCADQITGSTLGLSSNKYVVQIELQPLSSLQGSRMSLFNLYPLDRPLKPLGGSSLSMTNDTSTPFCWCFQLSANETGFYDSSVEVNASVTGYVPRYSKYTLSETKANLSPEPFTTLVVKVYEKKSRKVIFSDMKEVDSFLSPFNLPLKVNFSILGMPYVNVHICWLPLTAMDLEDLHISSSPESSLGRAGRHYRTADDNSDFNSLGSRKSHTSNQDNNETVSSTSFASSLGAGDYSYAQHISTNSNSKSRVEVEEEQGDGQPMTYQGVSSSESSLVYENIKNQFQSDDSSLGHIVEQLREMLEELSRRPNRYTRVLLILSNSLERLCEFTVSGDEEQDVPQIGLGSVPPRTDGHDEIEALDVLDRAVGSIQPAGNSPFSGCPQPTTSFSSPINTNTGSSARPYISSCGSFGDVGGVNATRQRADMTSGWAELDAVIRWHLQNVRRLLNVLASSPELFGMPGDLYGSGSGANGGANCKLSNPEHVLPVHQDSTAMALSDQAGILVALAGVVNFYDECRNQRQTICSTNCLDYGGTRSTGLLPGDFWRLVWDPEEGSMSRSQNSLLNLNSSSQTLNITLCIPREKLMEYFLHVCKDHCRFSDEDDVLQFAMEDLLDVVADSDITEHSWSYIPLTQICMRLKPTVRPSTAVPIYSPRTRSGSLQRQEVAIYSTLRYIRSQTRLQRKLRQHDAEALYQTLEKLSADVQKRQRGNMSVNTFICVALNLLIPEVSIQSLAEDVIKGLTRITFGVNSDSANIPFLRAFGPCYMFAKAMQTFNNQLDTSHLLNASGYPKRGGNAFSPISSTLLWGVQSRADEEYRIASLKAYKIIFGGTGGVGDVDTNSRQPYQHRGQGRPGETAMWLRGADTEALHAGVHLLSVEDDSPVVRNLALETIQFRRSNLGLARSKFRSANCLINN